MLRYFLIITSSLLWHSALAQQDVLGLWQTVDDETGEAKSVVKIYEYKGSIHGKIIRLLPSPGQPEDPVCDKCPPEDDRFGKKIIGMEIIRGLTLDGEEYVGGTVLKPDEGKVYKCKIWREGDVLKIRGYWGLFYRTQTWIRTE
jgi:uncharacterized protein (DUF2147 family)